MKTLLAILLAFSGHAHAQVSQCYLPQPPDPCKPHLVEGEPAHNRAELIRCVLADNTALRGYVRVAYFAIQECAAKVSSRP